MSRKKNKESKAVETGGKMKSAIITQSGGKAVELKESPGLFTCLMEHKVTETKAEFNYLGPKITYEQWDEMMAFFRWTFVEHSSEAQVRLFVHPQRGWKMWAFPQEGNTGMTTKELLDSDDTKKQRAEEIPDGFMAWGTVHHHCRAGAFQSGVDKDDEERQDGLHITVGDMEQPKHSLNCRLYIKGNKFEPNMAMFWEIGEEAKAQMELLSGLGYSVDDLCNKMARKQMGVPAEENQTFPELWKTNYITKPKVVYGSDWKEKNWCNWCHAWVTKDHTYDNCPNKGRGVGGGSPQYGAGYNPGGNVTTLQRKTAKEVLDEVETRGMLMGITDDDIYESIAELGDGQLSDMYQAIYEECLENLVSIKDLWTEMYKKIQRIAENKKNANGNGGGQLTKAEQEEKERQEALEQYYTGGC